MANLTNTENKPGKKTLVVTVTSTVLWVLSIILAFLIRAESPFSFIPDALLLLGFFPLLILWRRGWLTFLFGLFNTFIGFFLLILQYLPDEKFPGSMGMMRQHLLTMHSCWTWILLGLVALIWGTASIVISLARWILQRSQKSSQI